MMSDKIEIRFSDNEGVVFQLFRDEQTEAATRRLVEALRRNELRVDVTLERHLNSPVESLELASELATTRQRLAEAEADAKEARRQLGFANLYLSPACPDGIRRGLAAFLAAFPEER
jgi:hypothetical protein